MQHLAKDYFTFQMQRRCTEFLKHSIGSENLGENVKLESITDEKNVRKWKNILFRLPSLLFHMNLNKEKYPLIVTLQKKKKINDMQTFTIRQCNILITIQISKNPKGFPPRLGGSEGQLTKEKCSAHYSSLLEQFFFFKESISNITAIPLQRD